MQKTTDTSDEACAIACMLVSNPGETIRRPGWQKRVNDLIRALRDERNALAEALPSLVDMLQILAASGELSPASEKAVRRLLTKLGLNEGSK